MKKQYPKDVKFYVADEVRMDNTQRPMIMGLFTDDLILIDAPKEIVPSQENPIVIQGLCFLVACIDCKGEFKTKFNVITPEGNDLFATEDTSGVAKTVDEVSRNNLNLILNFKPFPIVKYGKYKLVFTLDTKTYDFTFGVECKNK